MSDDDFPLAEQLEEAGSAAAMAALILRVPDAVLVTHGVHIEAACAALGFRLGAEFILARSVALHAVRDAHGLMPAALAERIELERVALSRLSAGGT